MRPLFAVAFATLALAPVPAAAASCSVDAQPVSFGAYDSLAMQPSDGVGTVHVTCDTSVDFTVALGTGNGTVADRILMGGADRLHYNLYTNASRTTVWGDGNSGADVGASGTSVNLPVYGRIPSLQRVPAGSYADSIVVTVTY